MKIQDLKSGQKFRFEKCKVEYEFKFHYNGLSHYWRRSNMKAFKTGEHKNVIQIGRASCRVRV